MTLNFVPTKRHQVARLFLSEEIEKSKESISPQSNNWVEWKVDTLNNMGLYWIRTNSGIIKKAIFFAKIPHWYEIDNPELIENVTHYIKIE